MSHVRAYKRCGTKSIQAGVVSAMVRQLFRAVVAAGWSHATVCSHRWCDRSVDAARR
ncbi:hypothetical protein Tcan_06228 [Toxocara canis]|uniref:Uncharacterized protein n=1 Tax=Toxocara canis TaxID=6265 RepID=A0A0B2UWG7_TOXCA|nr:hypothetical protein Tcan_06228 [Toxocara canis]